MKRRSSLRTTLAPIPSTPIVSLPVGPHRQRILLAQIAVSFWFRKSNLSDHELGWLFRGLRNLHAAGGVEHRFDDIVVAGAAADIALKLVPDGVLVELAAVAMNDIDRRHDHARCAVTSTDRKSTRLNSSHSS